MSDGKEYPTDEVVVLRNEAAMKDRLIEELRAHVSGLQHKIRSMDGSPVKHRNKVQELKGNLISMVSMFREQRTRADRLAKQVCAFRGIWDIQQPDSTKTTYTIAVVEPALVAYFSKYPHTAPKEP